MQNEISYIYLDQEYNQLFSKFDKQAERVPQQGEVLHLKHTTGATSENHHYGKVLMVVESKHLYGFPKLEDCVVQRSRTLVYVQRLLVEEGIPAYLQLLQRLEAGVELIAVEAQATPQIQINLLPTVYAGNRLELLPEIVECATAYQVPAVEEIADAPQSESEQAAPMLPLSEKIVKALILASGISYPTRKKLFKAMNGVQLDEQVSARKLKAIFRTLSRVAKIRKDSEAKLMEHVENHINKHNP